MKKFMTLAVILIIMSGCGNSTKSNTDNEQVTYHTIFAERMQLANSFEELESVSDVIVKATVAEGKENIRPFAMAMGEVRAGYYGFAFD